MFQVDAKTWSFCRLTCAMDILRECLWILWENYICYRMAQKTTGTDSAAARGTQSQKKVTVHINERDEGFSEGATEHSSLTTYLRP